VLLGAPNNKCAKSLSGNGPPREDQWPKQRNQNPNAYSLTMALTIEDKLAIHELASAYCHLIDAGRGPEWADLFTEDGVFEIVDLITTEGREALVANATVFPEMMPGVRHIVHNVWVTEGSTTDTATMLAYLSNLRAGDKTEWVQTGIYKDDLVRTPDGWRFARRTLTLDGPLF